MKNFDFKRCVQVVKWNIIANKASLLNTFVALIAGVVIIHSLNTGMLWGEGFDTYKVAATGNIITAVAAIYLLITAARMNFNMQKKGDIINYAMLPATKLEKFWANWFMQVPLVLVMMIAATLAGDFIQMAISLVRHGDAASITLQIIDSSLPSFLITEGHVDQMILGILSALIFHATFLFGGVFFRRHPVLLTVVCWIVVPMIIGSVLAAIGAIVAQAFMNANYDITVEWLVSPSTAYVLTAIGSILFEMLVLALIYWLTYKRFCKTQVINNRFFN